jgi:hypothetical protein
MESHEGKRMGVRTGRMRLVAAATALVGAVALGVPGVAGAAPSSRSYSPAPTSSPLLITQNTAMIVDVSGTSTTAVDVVSWSDVSWSDVY